MDFNVSKCKVTHFGNQDSENKYTVQGIDIKKIKEEKDLGIIIRNDLKVSAQCEKAASKGNQILGLMFRTIACRNKEIIIKLYKSPVRPHLNPCLQALRSHLKKTPPAPFQIFPARSCMEVSIH